MKRIRQAYCQVDVTEPYDYPVNQATKRQRAKPLPQESVQQECDRVFNLSSDILSVVGFDGYFKRLNPACDRILGFSQNQLLATPCLELVHPDDRAATVAVLQKLTAGQRVDHFENRYRCEAGDYKWLAWSGIGVVEEGLIYWAARDITAQKQAEAALQQSKHYYETLIHSLEGIVWEIDLQTQQFVFVSHKAESILGYPVEQWLTEADFWVNHIHPEDREWVINRCHELVLQKQQGPLEYRMIAANGRIVWLQDVISLVMEAERPVRLRGLMIDVTESQRTKAILHQREQEFRALVENLPDVILRVDRNFRYLYANPQVVERLGISLAHYRGKTSEELGFPDELVSLWHRAVQRVFETQQEQWIEFEIDGSAGRVFNHSRLVPEFGADGAVESVLIVIRDITERKQLESALRESEARYRLLASRFPDGVVLLFDRDLRYVLADGTDIGILGLSKAEIEGRTIWEVLPPETCEWVEPYYRAALEGNASVVEVPLANQVYLVHFLPIRNEDERLAAGMVIARNITESKRVEADLRESEERFRQIAENIHDVFWVADLDLTRIIYISPAYEDVWGRTCQSLYEQPKSFVEVVHPEDRNRVIAVLEQQRSTGFSHEYRIVQPDGSIRWIWERASVVNDATGQPYRVVGLSQDISDRKRAEEALRLADFSFDRSAFAAVWIGSDGRILRVNEGTCQLLGYSREEIQSKYVYDLDPNFPQENWLEHWQQLRQQKTLTFTSQLQRKDGSLVPIETTLNYLEFNGNEYNFAFARDITERLQAETTLKYQREQEQLVVSITQHIRQSLDLTEILAKTVTTVREFLQSDRVLIYHLKPEIGGCVIAESVADEWVNVSGTIINDDHFNERYAQLYQQGRVQAVDDIYTAGLTPCHRDLLAQFQVRANLAVPIAHEGELWGLLVVQQCSAPRHWQPLEINLLKQLATQVAISIQQSELYQHAQAEISHRQQAEIALRQQAERERLLATTAQHIRRSLDLSNVLDTTVTEVRRLLQADRVLLYHVDPDGIGCVITESVNPQFSAILDQPLPPEIFPKDCHQLYRQGRIRKITDIETDEMSACLAETLRHFEVRSKLVVPILQGENLWGLLIAHQCSGPREWQVDEVDLLQQLATQVAIAIQQAELHQQVQQLNFNLESQVQERTLELQQALELEALLKRITDKVRDSLDEAQILQTAVQELALGLKVRCCDTALYDFDLGQSTIRFESITPGVPPAKGQTYSFSNIPEVYNQLLKGQYVQFSTLIAPDFWRGSAAPQFTVLSCPLMDDQGVLGDLWLFRSHEDSFNTLEVRLVEQVANQCAIALRQSRLYQAAQAQVVELERLNGLKDDFLSTVSHELRTPMSNIKMAIQMLEVIQAQPHAATAKADQATRYFNILKTECQREINLINNLLDLTRLDAGDDPLNLVTVDLPRWLPQVVEPFEHRAYNQQQQLELCIPSALPPVTTDLSYLERILSELLNNACKYTPAGERIVVTVAATPGAADALDAATASLLISVSNSGVEVPDSELEHIFDKFYRVPNNDPWKHGGTGLGLALVKRLVEGLNGTIEVRSYSQQTTFAIQLPIVGE